MTQREKALLWWNGLELKIQLDLTQVYHKGLGRRSNTLTGREIEHIWRSERNEFVFSTFEPSDFDE